MGHRDNLGNHLKLTVLHFAVNTKFNFRSCLILCLLVFVQKAGAEVIPHLTVAQYYNDNVRQAPEGQEQSARITEVQPGIIVNHDGRRIDYQLDYTLQALYFSSNHDKDEVYHTANAQTNVTVFPHLLFVDASVNYSEQFISPDGVIDLDNLSESQNSVAITTYSVSPYVRQRFGSFVDAEYRLEHSEVKYGDDATITQTDSETRTASANISSGLSFDEFRWQLNLSRSELRAENTDDSVIQNALLETRYQVSSKVELLGNIGYDDNDFQYADPSEDPSGSYWSAGIGWSPTRRTQVEVTTGERFFGKTSSLSFSHRTRRSIWNIEYYEEITTTPELQQSVDLLPPAEEGEPVLPASPDSVLLVRAASVIVLERFSVGMGFRTGKTTIDLSLFNESRNYQDLDQEEKTMGGVFSWRWRFLSRTFLSLSGTRHKLELITLNQVDYISQAELAIERQIRRTVNGSVGIRTTDRNSTNNLSEYRRNLAFISLSMQF